MEKQKLEDMQRGVNITIGALIVVVFIFILKSCLSDNPKPQKESTDISDSILRKANEDYYASEPAIKISVERLYTRYLTNNLAARDELDAKKIRTFGTVGVITRTKDNYPILSLWDESKSVQLYCEFGEAEVYKLRGLNSGDYITVEGKCYGYEFDIQKITLTNCKIIEQ